MKWKVISSTEIFRAGFVNLRSEKCELPDGRIYPNYYIITYWDWVNVVALTKDRKLVMIKQYRHAAGGECIEIPGGAISPKHKEDPEAAGRRELIEETGYVPKKMIFLGKHQPNPAIQDNWLHTYLALDCEKLEEQNLDEFECIEVYESSIDEVLKQVQEGGITHSLVITALHLALPHLKK